MTPEQAAQDILDGLIPHDEQLPSDDTAFVLRIVRAAVEAEREACAQLMDSMWANTEAGEAIRARKEVTQ